MKVEVVIGALSVVLEVSVASVVGWSLTGESVAEVVVLAALDMFWYV